MALPNLPIQDLRDRLNQLGESQEVEAKFSEFELGKSALETISAFANAPAVGVANRGGDWTNREAR